MNSIVFCKILYRLIRCTHDSRYKNLSYHKMYIKKIHWKQWIDRSCYKSLSFCAIKQSTRSKNINNKISRNFDWNWSAFVRKLIMMSFLVSYAKSIRTWLDRLLNVEIVSNYQRAGFQMKIQWFLEFYWIQENLLNIVKLLKLLCCFFQKSPISLDHSAFASYFHLRIGKHETGLFWNWLR